MDKTFQQVLRYRSYLDNIFYGEGLLMKGLPVFIKAVRAEELHKNGYHDIPYGVLEMYYNNQSVVQIFKPVPKIKDYVPIISLLPFERVYCDSMYLTLKGSVLGFINIVDLFSKYAFSKMFILPSKTSAMSSNKAVLTFNDFLNQVKSFGFEIGYVVTDRGSEFLGDFMKDLEDKKIIHIYANAGDKRKTSPIERFNKTMRLMIEKYRVVYGKISNGVVDKLIKSYNNIPHANLKYSPIEILNSKSMQDEITSNNYNLQKDIIPSTPISGYCRILINKTFKKVSPIWTTEIYKIKSHLNGNYVLEELPNKFFKRDELQPVEKEYLLGKNVRLDDSVKEIRRVVDNEPEYSRRVSQRIPVPNSRYY